MSQKKKSIARLVRLRIGFFVFVKATFSLLLNRPLGGSSASKKYKTLVRFVNQPSTKRCFPCFYDRHRVNNGSANNNRSNYLKKKIFLLTGNRCHLVVESKTSIWNEKRKKKIYIRRLEIFNTLKMKHDISTWKLSSTFVSFARQNKAAN